MTSEYNYVERVASIRKKVSKLFVIIYFHKKNYEIIKSLDLISHAYK